MLQFLHRFDHILKSKGIYVLRYFQFLKWNLIIMPVLATGAACVLIGELWYMYLRWKGLSGWILPNFVKVQSWTTNMTIKCLLYIHNTLSEKFVNTKFEICTCSLSTFWKTSLFLDIQYGSKKQTPSKNKCARFLISFCRSANATSLVAFTSLLQPMPHVYWCKDG